MYQNRDLHVLTYGGPIKIPFCLLATFEPRRHFCPGRPHDLVRRIVEGRTQLRRVRHLLRQRGHRLAVETTQGHAVLRRGRSWGRCLGMQAGDLPAAPDWRSDSAARLADPSHCRPLSTATSVREPWRQPQDRTLSPLASLYAVLRVAQLHVCALDKVRAHVSRLAHEGWRQVWLPLVPEGCFQHCIFQIAILLRLLQFGTLFPAARSVYRL